LFRRQIGKHYLSPFLALVKEIIMAKHRIAPVHPGVYLKELLRELELSQYRLAQELGVPAMRINHVVNGKRPVTAELALRLGRYFGQNPRYWINLQSRYDMDVAEDALSERVSREVRPIMAAVQS
jgi:antitoxin HigA-1